ncbi:MAG: helix-turn-helix domain-containing protein [Lentisphaerota bacterium]
MNIKIDKIINLRKSKGLTIIRLAKLLDVTTRTVYNWESGRSYPSKAELTAIAHLLNVRLCEISDYKDFPLFYSKPSLLPKQTVQLNSIIDQYKATPDFNPYPILKVINENIRLTSENKRFDMNLKRYKSLLDSLNVIIYTKDNNRTIRYYNKSFLNIIPDSIREENILGSKFSDIFKSGENEEVSKMENDIFLNGIPVADKKINIVLLGDKCKCLFSITPISENENIVSEILVSIKNVSFLS